MTVRTVYWTELSGMSHSSVRSQLIVILNVTTAVAAE
jgi:hypothetical protein